MTDANGEQYARYGGRGIKVCKRWDKFENFLADMGNPPKGMTLDRIDNDGDYKKSNCRWATAVEQQSNKSTNRRITLKGKTQTLSQWCRELGLPKGVVSNRIHRGWSEEKALITPVRVYNA